GNFPYDAFATIGKHYQRIRIKATQTRSLDQIPVDGYHLPHRSAFLYQIMKVFFAHGAAVSGGWGTGWAASCGMAFLSAPKQNSSLLSSWLRRLKSYILAGVYIRHPAAIVGWMP